MVVAHALKHLAVEHRQVEVSSTKSEKGGHC
jgi:hypothetical protein